MPTLKFSDYLTESLQDSVPTPQVVPGSYADVIKNAVPEYGDAIRCASQGTVLYRAVKLPMTKSYLVDPRTATRKSTNEHNHHTILMSDILPSWAKYPRRDKSLCCTNSEYVALNYGRQVFVTLPHNGTTLAVAPLGDMWESFSTTNLENLAWAIIDAVSKTMPTDSYKAARYHADHLETLIDISSILEIVGVRANKAELTEWLDSHNLTATFDKYLNPESNGFKLINISELPSINKRSHEVWFSAPAILIPDDQFIAPTNQ